MNSSAPSTPAAPSPRTTPSPAKGKNGKKKKNVLIEEPEKDKATPVCTRNWTVHSNIKSYKNGKLKAMIL